MCKWSCKCITHDVLNFFWKGNRFQRRRAKRCSCRCPIAFVFCPQLCDGIGLENDHFCNMVLLTKETQIYLLLAIFLLVYRIYLHVEYHLIGVLSCTKLVNYQTIDNNQIVSKMLRNLPSNKHIQEDRKWNDMCQFFTYLFSVHLPLQNTTDDK